MKRMGQAGVRKRLGLPGEVILFVSPVLCEGAGVDFGVWYQPRSLAVGSFFGHTIPDFTKIGGNAAGSGAYRQLTAVAKKYFWEGSGAVRGAKGFQNSAIGAMKLFRCLLGKELYYVSAGWLHAHRRPFAGCD